MKSVLEYQNYRAFIQDYYDEMKSRRLLSWRIFAKQAGFSSPSYLKLICQGKSTLSDDGIEQVAKAMELKGFQLDYFRILVKFNQAKKAEEQQVYLAKLNEFSKTYQVKILDDNMFSYFSSWLNPVLRELAPNVSSTKPSEIARRMLPSTTGDDVKNSLAFLVKNGLLTVNPDGSYTQTDRSISSGNKTVTSAALRSLHKQIGTLALDTLDSVPVSERNFSEVIFGVTKEGYEKIVAEIADFRQKIVSIAAQNEGMDRVYAMNFQLFPLTHKNTSKPSLKKKHSIEKDSETNEK